MEHEGTGKRHKLGVANGVYIPVCLNILSILMFLRFGLILGEIGLLCTLALLLLAYIIDFLTALSLSAIASNGEVKGGGAYYLISRSLGPEFGGSIGILFYLAQVLNTALNVVGLINCLKTNLPSVLPSGYWWDYTFASAALLVCMVLCLAGSSTFAKANNVLLFVLTLAIASIPLSAVFMTPFEDPVLDIEYTGIRLATLTSNLYPHTSGKDFQGLATFRNYFGILFPATSGIFAGASMSGDLRNPSRSIPKGTLWAMLSTFIAYLIVVLSLASTTKHVSLLRNTDIIQDINIWSPVILAGECAVTFFSALMGIIGAAKLMQALARDDLVSILAVFGQGTVHADEPVMAILLTYILAQFALFADLNRIATLISTGYQATFLVMNLACFLLKVGSAPNFRPGFKFFSWKSALLGSCLSLAAMFFIHTTYASVAVFLGVSLFALIHYFSPPKHWGDVSQNLIYHQVRKYLLRLKPEHIKFWRPQIILFINDARKQTRLIQFCNSMKKGSLYILAHVVVTDDFSSGIAEVKTQQRAWTEYITKSEIKAFVQLAMSPSIVWGARNIILSAGLGGMRPNIAVLGFYNMEDMRKPKSSNNKPERSISPEAASTHKKDTEIKQKGLRRRRGDTSARLMAGFLPTDVIKTEGTMAVTSYMTILEDLALRHRVNVAVAKDFHTLEAPRSDGGNSKTYIDLWPIQISAEISAEGRNTLTTNFDTYTLILQLGYILRTVQTWKKAYRLRILVFVEYESEVDLARARVQALLDKLRIEASILVFSLASGQLPTYEIITQGRFVSPEADARVSDALKGETWWEDLKRNRDLQSLNASMAASRQRGARNSLTVLDDANLGRRFSTGPISVDLPKKPTVSMLSRMGIDMSIHTQNLLPDVFDESGSERAQDADNESTSSETNSEADFNDVASEGDAEDTWTSRQPLLLSSRRRKSHGDVQQKPKSPKKRTDRQRSAFQDFSERQTYGTIASPRSADQDDGDAEGFGMPDTTAAYTAREGLAGTDDPKYQAAELSNIDSASLAPLGSTRAERTTRSRRGSMVKFSSLLVPEAMVINDETSGPRISFAEPGAVEAASPERPTFSRQSSMVRFLRKLGPETNPTEGEGSVTAAVSFASGSRSRSGRTSPIQGTGAKDAYIDIPNLQKSQDTAQSRRGSGLDAAYISNNESLSFNDLPRRAQHLILNELIRHNSDDTAVLFTTLPIPEEGTCQEEDTSLRYLSDIEVLCAELPPVLLVLSNNMTVTVSI